MANISLISLNERCFKVDNALLVSSSENIIYDLNNHSKKIKVEPRLMRILVRLAQEPYKVIARKDLIECLGPTDKYADEALTLGVSRLRKIFSRCFDRDHIIKTIPKVGYKLIAEVAYSDKGQPRMRISKSVYIAFFALITLITLILVRIQYDVILETPTDLRGITKTETSYPSWSPDGNHLVVQSNRLDDDSEIYLMNDDGSNLRRLTFNEGLDEYPNFSPIDDKIAFTSSKDGNQDIYLMNADGGEQINLTNHPAKDILPRWSPDGLQIIFNSDREGNLDLYTYNLRTSHLERLTASPLNDKYASWSPAGDQIVFVRQFPISGKVNSEIFILDPKTKKEKRLSNNPAYDGWPAWSSDGNEIFFSSNRDGKHFQIYVMNSDGKETYKLTHGEAEGADYTKPIAVSDGSNRIACTRTKDGNVEVYIIHRQATATSKIVMSRLN